MSTLTIPNLLQSMLTAAKQQATQEWSQIESYMQQQLQLLAESLLKFTELYSTKKISQTDLQLDLQELKNTTKMTLITEAGLTEELADAMLNAALNAIKTTINSVIGFVLI